MTMTQKILAQAAGLASVQPGQLIMARLDRVLANDITAPVAINEFRGMGAAAVFDTEKVTLVMDHFAPNKDIKSAEQCRSCRDFADEMGIPGFYDGGQMGVEHALLPEQGLVTAGDVIIGADSHTCTYGALGAFSTGVGSTDMAVGMLTGKAWFKVPEAIRFVLHGQLGEWVSGKDLILHIIGLIGVDGALYRSMEFQGDGVASLSISDRLTVCNMAIEAGAKNGIFPVDQQTTDFLAGAGAKAGQAFAADEDAVYLQSIDIDLGSITPTVAFPHLPENARVFDGSGWVSRRGTAAGAGGAGGAATTAAATTAARARASGAATTAAATNGGGASLAIDQVVIGSCTNGRLEDLQIAASLLKGRKVAKNVRAIIIPATPKIYLEAMEQGLLKTFIEAGALVSAPTCGPCLGGHMGILAEGERAVATTNRNFVGRMGHVGSEVYLASPATAAASAVTGRLTSPLELVDCQAAPSKAGY
jgi:3-isopropylmalate/(R)-2-methylmalate dehydratase large subunit